MDLLEAIATRRSVRRYRPDPVEEEKIRAVFESARAAPSWANTQCVRYTLVTDPELKAALIDTFSERNPARKGAAVAPCLVVVSALTDRAGFKHGEPVTDKGGYWYMFDAALGVQNLTLAAHALGLGTVHVGWFDAGEAARLLDLPDDEVMVELLPLGYPDHEPRTPPRLPLEELVRRR